MIRIRRIDLLGIIVAVAITSSAMTILITTNP